LSPEQTRRTSAVTEHFLPGSNRRALSTETVVIRGEDAARAKRIDLVGAGRHQVVDPAKAYGPWAEELEQARDEARARGYAEGHDQGMTDGLAQAHEQAQAEVQALEERFQRELGELGDVVRTMLDGIDERCDEVGDQLAAQVVDLALEVAEAVIGREVSVATDPGADAVARCIEMVPGTGTLVVRLHPDDVALFDTLPGLDGRELVVAADPSLERGDAIVSADQVTIDARLSTSLERVAEALR
jgi:flagellar assembly protein FliH